MNIDIYDKFLNLVVYCLFCKENTTLFVQILLGVPLIYVL